MTQQLKSKAWADIVESLIGLVYLEAGEMAAMEFLVYLGIMPEVPRGFEREKPTVDITEVDTSLEDDQLAAEIAAVETAAATLGVNDADAAAPEPMQAGAVTAKPAGDAAAEPAVDAAAGAAGDTAGEPAAAAAADIAADPACGAAAESAGDADVAMNDAFESAGAAQDTDLADYAQGAAAMPAAAAAAAAVPASATAGTLKEATDAQHTGFHPSQTADKAIAPSADSSARESDAESEMVVDNSGYGHASNYHNGAPLAISHPAQHNGVQLNGNHPNDVHPNSLRGYGVQNGLPELSVSSANGRGTSAAVRSGSETRSGKPASNLQPHVNGHAGVVVKQEVDVAGFVDPNVIDIGDGEDELQHDSHHLLAEEPSVPQPKQEPKHEVVQSGYPSQSGYGEIELSESEQSDAPNPEEISIAKPEKELGTHLPPSPSHPVQLMDTDPPAAGTPPAAPAPAATAPELANGDAPVPGLNRAASGEPVKIKIEPGLEAGGASKPDQNQIEMDAMAFLAVNDDDSEDELPQARPGRGQVSIQSFSFSPLFHSIQLQHPSWSRVM